MNSNYAKAYKEVLEIIKLFPKEEYIKIPKEKIEYFKKNMDNSYDFSFNPEFDLLDQDISKETKAIIIALYQDYFATEDEKREIESVLNENELRIEKEKSINYNPDELFNKKNDIQKQQFNNKQDTKLIVKKEDFFTRLKKFIYKLLHIKLHL